METVIIDEPNGPQFRRLKAINADLRAVMQGHVEWLITLSEDKSIPVEQRRICSNYVALGQAALERSKP